MAAVEVGQEVVLMALPGRFRVVAVDGDVLTIENDAGVRKRVRASAVRVVPPQAGGRAGAPAGSA